MQGITVSEAKGFRRQKGNRENYLSAEYSSAFLPKLGIKLYVTDSRAQPMSETFTRAAKTGVLGDGKILLSDTSPLYGSGSARRGNARCDDATGESG